MVTMPSMQPRPSAATGRTKTLGGVIVLALIVLLVVTDFRRRAVEYQLQQLTVHLDQLAGNQQQSQDAARQIVAKVGRHFAIPEGVTPTVAKIVDVASLRERNAFYARAENGDYLLVMPDRAILYSVSRDMILDVVPVQVQPAAPGGQGTAKQPAQGSAQPSGQR